MSTQRTQQVESDSLDTFGISIATAPKDPLNSRRGSLYGLDTLLQGNLIHSHLRGDGTVLSIFSSTVQGTTGSSPEYLTDSTYSEGPVWVNYDPSTGSQLTFHGLTVPREIPCSVASDGVEYTLQGACSRRDLLYTLLTLDGRSFVQPFGLSRVAFELKGEYVEGVQTSDEEVFFDRGCFLDKQYLVLIGRGLSTGKVYLCRKLSRRIGSLRDKWEYQSESGWFTNEEPVGIGVSTLGNCSGFVRGDTKFITTVELDGSNYVGSIYKYKYTGDSAKWHVVDTIPLTGDYANRGLRLQGHLTTRHDLGHTLLHVSTDYKTRVVEGRNEVSLQNIWGSSSVSY